MPDAPQGVTSAPALVTGGTGFLGRKIVERLLDQGRTVTVFSRRTPRDLAARGVRFVRASLSDAAAVEEACEGVETVFHVASKVGVWGRYNDFFMSNVLGTRAVVDSCRRQGVARLVYTSTPSVVYNGGDLSGVDESAPITVRCPSPYPLTKAMAETEVLAANGGALRTVALRPHLIWGVNDPNLIPRIIGSARAGKLRIVGSGHNRVDMVHIENAVDAHLAAESALADNAAAAAGKAYFITNGEPVLLWQWINRVLHGVGEAPVSRRVSLRAATALGALCEAAWRCLPLRGEPPMTRFVAAELAKDHWFDISAARRDLGYAPRITMEAGTAQLITWLKAILELADARPQIA
ncbi:MAG TPA: NAD-dependent epimerase/dehydratase family protein [Opitutaceae bacterium]|jgi:nucleoside-diphosphate-sugar epimerase|nr:NAD-dependent epimerase/dehydratase family protein [Opitutaceae bacterium]